MTTLDILTLVLEIEQAGANVNVTYISKSQMITVHVTFPQGHKYEKHERFYTIFADDSEDVEKRCKELRKIKAAMV